MFLENHVSGFVFALARSFTTFVQGNTETMSMYVEMLSFCHTNISLLCIVTRDKKDL